MKIVHVVRSLDPAAGGPPQVCLRLGAAQAALGHDVHVVHYSTAADRARVEREIKLVPHHQRLRVHALTDPGKIERLFARRARRMLDELLASADFTHIHGIWGAVLATAADVAKRRGVPFCFQPHGMLDPWSLSQKAWKKRLALALRYRALLGQAAFIQTLNSDEQRLIEPLALGVPTVVVPNGIFIEEIEPLPAPGTFRAAYPQLGDRPFVLFLSRLHPKKGLDVLAEAFSKLSKQRDDVRLVVAGPDDGAREDFERRVEDLGIGHQVHLVGPLYGLDKMAAFVDATCFCLPSRQEGFSVAIVEAMACGIPVVITEACHFPEVAEASAGLVVPLTADAISTSLASLVGDEEKRARLGAAGAALVRSRYRWEAIGEQSIACYQRAISRGRA